jgi:hypothetical protein
MDKSYVINEDKDGKIHIIYTDEARVPSILAQMLTDWSY